MTTGSMLTSPVRALSWEPGPAPRRVPSRVDGAAGPGRPLGREGVVRVAIVEPHPLVVAGWEQLLRDTPMPRYRVVDGSSPETADVTLYGLDPGDGTGRHDPDLHGLLRSTRSRVIVTHWDDAPWAVEAALRCGARGSLSRRLPQEALLAGIEKILGGRDPRPGPPEDGSCHPEVERSGLTGREVDVLCLVAAGLTNQEIAERLYLSINTVKTYIRYGYRKIGAERRSHAVIWVERHGLTSRASGGGRRLTW